MERLYIYVETGKKDLIKAKAKKLGFVSDNGKPNTNAFVNYIIDTELLDEKMFSLDESLKTSVQDEIKPLNKKIDLLLKEVGISYED